MTELDKEVLAKIERLGLKPRPYVYFLARRSVFWGLAALSILLGGVSLAVAIFASTDLATTGGRGFDEMPFDDIATSLPALWLACFALFAASAWFNLSRTRRGYRFRPLSILVTAFAASLGLGIALHGLDAGRLTHNFITRQFPAYARFTHIPYDEWSRPAQGYLGGKVLWVNGSSLQLKAFDGLEWTVDISTAVTGVDEPLLSEGDIAIRGETTGPQTFKAHTIAPFD
jgi:hypothetical protein